MMLMSPAHSASFSLLRLKTNFLNDESLLINWICQKLPGTAEIAAYMIISISQSILQIFAL